jgi:hypothetical protein
LSGLSVSERNFLTAPFDTTEVIARPGQSDHSQTNSAEFGLLLSEEQSYSRCASDLFRQDSAFARKSVQAVTKQRLKQPSASSRDLSNELERRVPIDDNLNGRSSEDGERVLDTGEYEHFRTEYIFGDLRDEESPLYDSGRNLTPHISNDLIHRSSTTSLSTQMFQRISRSNSSSPRSIRAGTTHRADVGDLFWTADVLDRQAALTQHADAGTMQLGPAMGHEPRDADQQGENAGCSENIHALCPRADLVEDERNNENSQTSDPDSWLLPHERALFAQPLPLRLKNRHVNNTSDDAPNTGRPSSRISKDNDIEDDVFADTKASEFDRVFGASKDDSSCPSSRKTSRQHDLRPYPHIL